jgi:hypothetical protein
MSINTVRAAIVRATADGSITKAEAEAIVAKAKEGPLTKGEIKVIDAAYNAPRAIVTQAIGEGPNYSITAGGNRVFEKFLGLPSAVEATLTPARIAQLEARATALSTAGTLNFVANTLDAKNYVEHALSNDTSPPSAPVPDALYLSVLVPAGPGVDPNTVDSFYLRQTGGIAGFNLVAGPFSLQGEVASPVKNLIAAATSDGSLSAPEAQSIIAAATAGPLNNADVKAIVEAYEVPRMMYTMMLGEGPGYRTTPQADDAFHAFFAANSLPVGDAGQSILGRLSSLISFKKLTNQLEGKALAAAPANLDQMVSARLSDPQRTPSSSTIYVDASKREFYYAEQLLVRIFPKPEPKFYGPFSVDEPVPQIGVPGFGGPQPLPGVGQPGGRPN